MTDPRIRPLSVTRASRPSVLYYSVGLGRDDAVNQLDELNAAWCREYEMHEDNVSESHSNLTRVWRKGRRKPVRFMGYYMDILGEREH